MLQPFSSAFLILFEKHILMLENSFSLLSKHRASRTPSHSPLLPQLWRMEELRKRGWSRMSLGTSFQVTRHLGAAVWGRLDCHQTGANFLRHLLLSYQVISW